MCAGAAPAAMAISRYPERFSTTRGTTGGRAGSYDWLCKTITGMLRALRGRGGVPLDPGWNTLVVVFVLVVVVDVVLGEGFFESVGGVRVRL